MVRTGVKRYKREGEHDANRDLTMFTHHQGDAPIRLPKI